MMLRYMCSLRAVGGVRSIPESRNERVELDLTSGTTNPPDDSGRSGPGRLVGDYRLVRPISSGPMGDVYLARHRQYAHREYAIKLIRAEVSSDPARQRFVEEIHAMGGLLHPNLVYANDDGIEDQPMYLALDYVSGENLQDLIDQRDENGLFCVRAASEILRQICAGVGHAHQRGVAHRDIRPANVILDDDFVVKVLDLGIASLQGEEAYWMTQAGDLMGSAAYAAPELWDGANNASAASDVYAIGCTAYRLFTGEPPFSGDEYQSQAQLLRAHQKTNPQPLHQRREDVPEELSAIIHRALHKRPAKRYKSAGEFADQLAPYCEPLRKDTSLFVDPLQLAETYRSSISIPIPAESATGIGLWIFAALITLFAIGSRLLAHINSDVTGNHVTLAWERVFDQLGAVNNSPLLGPTLDCLFVLLLVPLACFALVRNYPDEIYRSISMRQWTGSNTVARVVLLSVLGILAYFVWEEHWNANHLATSLASWAKQADVDVATEASKELGSIRRDVGFALVSKAFLPTLTLVFPITWFVISGVLQLRRRRQVLMGKQSQSTSAKTMTKNLFRFGEDLLDRAGRVTEVCLIGVLWLHYNYWTALYVESGAGPGTPFEFALSAFTIATAGLASFLVLMFATHAVVFVRGFAVTRQLIALSDSTQDEFDLSRLGPGWFTRNLLVKRVTNIGCLSLLLIFSSPVFESSAEGIAKYRAKRDEAARIEAQRQENLRLSELEMQNELARAQQENEIQSQLMKIQQENEEQKRRAELAKRTPTWVPPRCRPSDDAELITIEYLSSTERLYTAIELQLNTVNIPFVLVPQINSRSPRSFYIMKDKVWIGLYAQFDTDYLKRQAERSMGLRSPAYFVSGRDAFIFAEDSLRGRLPTTQQWDAAYGRFYAQSQIRSHVTSPADYADRMPESLEPGPEDEAFDRDVNPWGCIDMDRNGLEFTRTDPTRGNVEKPEEINEFELRSKSQQYDDPEEDFGEGGPLRLKDWIAAIEGPSRYTETKWFGAWDIEAQLPDVTFRVVLVQDAD